MQSQKEAILKVLLYIAKKYQKAYCYPSQERIRVLLAKYQKIRISTRTLNRRLREMELDGYFGRTRRHRRGDDGRMVFCSTLYRLMGRAFNEVYGWGKLVGSFFSFFHLPKLAQYRATTARDRGSCGSLAGLVDKFLSKGGASRTIPAVQKIFLPQQ